LDLGDTTRTHPRPRAIRPCHDTKLTNKRSTVLDKLRSCLETKFLKTTVFEILQYILVMIIPQFTIPQF
jgi:hypothetical protein